MIIGLSGRAGAGKSTAAEYFEALWFRRDAYAKTLKEAVSIIFNIPMEILTANLETKNQVDPYWDMTYRKIMQVFGTEAMRETFGENVWERVLWRRHTDISYNLVIDDVRFTNEAQAILDRGGIIIDVKRGPQANDDPHRSEQGLPSELITYQVFNNGTKSELVSALWKVLTAGKPESHT